MYCVYHIGMVGDHDTSKGYIGVTSDYQRRKGHHCQHVRRKDFRQPLYKFLDEVGLDNVEFNIIFTGTKEECYKLEETLRPDFDIGWNTTPGGSDKRYSRERVTVDGVEYMSIQKAKEATGYDYLTLKKIQKGIEVFKVYSGADNVNSKPVTLTHPNTGEEYLFPCLKDAWNWLGKEGGVSGNIAKQKAKGRTAYGYYWNY